MEVMSDNVVVEDWISGLPNEILVDIISGLSLVEAARTSVLSTRWKDLWTFNTVLNFEAPRKLWRVVNKLDKKELLAKRSKYIRWVNRVLELHGGSSLNELRIFYELYDSHGSTITNWIHTALLKGVQKLELNLRPAWGNQQYTFPQEMHGISTLTSLSLIRVNVTRDILESFIYHCPLLERLCVVDSSHLLGLKVVGSSIRLKYLQINCFSSSGDFEISAPSLLSFKYYGSLIKLNVQNVPQLLDGSIGSYYQTELRNIIQPIINYLTQLETLELHFSLREYNSQSPLCELPKLRHLTLSVSGPGTKNLLVLTCMIKSCPFLRKFTLKFEHVGSKRKRKIQQFPKHIHEHLKVVEFIGFVGYAIDLELAFYLLENAIVLEKIIINPTSLSSLGSYWEFEDNEEKKAARLRAKKLEEKVPRGVELVIC